VARVLVSSSFRDNSVEKDEVCRPSGAEDMGQESPVRTDPFFIVGMQRSGTTMLRLMLNAHRNLAVPFESDFIPRVYQNLCQYGDLSIRENAAACLGDISRQDKPKRGKLIEDPEAVLAHEIRNYADLVRAIFEEYAMRRGKPRWGDKTPTHVLDLDLLWNLFPSCRVIHVVRDGRDVALSLLAMEWGSNNLLKIADDWRLKTVLGHKMGAFLGKQYLEIRYEDLVLHPEENLRRICDFLGEPFDENMLDYHKSAQSEMPSDSLKWHGTSVSRPDPKKIGMWKSKMSMSDRILFEQVAGVELQMFGYPREALSPTIRSKIKKVYYCLWNRY